MWLTRLTLVALTLWFAAFHAARAHEPYSTWRQPNTNFPCCGDHDCYPTEAKHQAGVWWALRREDKKWLPVPQHLIIPGAAKDGQAHICAPAPGPEGTSDVIYCFMMGVMGG